VKQAKSDRPLVCIDDDQKHQANAEADKAIGSEQCG
jgi:hypothetical protein